MIVNTAALEERASSINRQSIKIAQISDELDRLSGELDDGGSAELAKIHLHHIARNLETDARKMNLLSDLLSRISAKYAQTEQKIMDAETELPRLNDELINAAFGAARSAVIRGNEKAEFDKDIQKNAELFEALKRACRISPAVIGENRPAWMAPIRKIFGKADNGDDEE